MFIVRWLSKRKYREKACRNMSSRGQNNQTATDHERLAPDGAVNNGLLNRFQFFSRKFVFYVSSI